MGKPKRSRGLGPSPERSESIPPPPPSLRAARKLEGTPDRVAHWLSTDRNHGWDRRKSPTLCPGSWGCVSEITTDLSQRGLGSRGSRLTHETVKIADDLRYWSEGADKETNAVFVGPERRHIRRNYLQPHFVGLHRHLSNKQNYFRHIRLV